MNTWRRAEALAKATSRKGKVRLAIEEVLADSVVGWNDGDLDRFMVAYHRGPETTYVAAGELVKGHTNVRAAYAQRFDSASPNSNGTLEIDVLQVTPLGRDYALLTGRYALTGGIGTATGLCTVVFRRTSAGWRIVFDHS